MAVPSELEAGGVRLPVIVQRERRRTARATIGPLGLTIRLPLGLTSGAGASQVQSMVRWATRAVERDPERFRIRTPRQYHDGDHLQLGDRTFRIGVRLQDRVSSTVAVAGDHITLTLSLRDSAEQRRNRAARLLSRAAGSQMLDDLRALIADLNRTHFGRTVGDVRYRFTTRRWGSCSANGDISISTRLLLAPRGMLEYVCVHELAHLLHHDHSARFWRVVAGALPDFRQRERWLTSHAADCQF
jgi:predicted metal-dependent hydrolase